MHWLIVNIPGNHVGIPGGGNVGVRYGGPRPSMTSGSSTCWNLTVKADYVLYMNLQHNIWAYTVFGIGIYYYILLIYKQPKRLDPADPLIQRRYRSRYPLERFTTANQLGDPIAGNFFIAQWDETVPPYGHVASTNSGKQGKT